ncbi:MAG: selenide, water dikinase SelD [Eubacteriales bacterium]
MNTLSFSNCTSGGCGAKLPPSLLSDVLGNIPKMESPQLLIGFEGADDAAVYEQVDGSCIISTTDFFSPMVEDPRLFGRIAAANALSDVYAMGGKPVMALNLVCFPEQLPIEVLGEILAGGGEKVLEAGAVIGGGHSIYDKEPKYGLCVTGIAHKSEIIRNNTPKIGDHLILTKALGVGIVMAAARVEMASPSAVTTATQSMERLNRYAAEKMSGFAVHACTDITGFGLLNHLLELCGDTVSARVSVGDIPVISEAVDYANEYLLTAAGQRNRNHFGTRGAVESLDFGMQEILFDPQTSGGLLLSVSADCSGELLKKIRQDDPIASIIGEVVERSDDVITFTT